MKSAAGLRESQLKRSLWAKFSRSLALKVVSVACRWQFHLFQGGQADAGRCGELEDMQPMWLPRVMECNLALRVVHSNI